MTESVLDSSIKAIHTTNLTKLLHMYNFATKDNTTHIIYLKCFLYNFLIYKKVPVYL
jgi:hypothetical protein